MSSIVECIPNFSEGRRSDVIDAIAIAVSDVHGVALLHRTSDFDHNRSVLTFAGSPESVVEAAFCAIKEASQLIDLTQHSGQHPRLGATDVVPFVPIRDASLADCAQLARRLGKRVGQELDLPVYLYEAAATQLERQNLADVRRGGYELLVQTIASDPARKPDFGKSKVGKAGAVIIGARDILIAFNVFLDTSDVEIAIEIARQIRASSGGLPYVKALGLLVNGYAQVSMNLTNYKLTPVHQVVENIEQLANQMGVSILKSELIGLIPEDVFNLTTAQNLHLTDFSQDQILEVALRRANLL